ncbi:MAG: hypothetical protein QF824_00245 [Candidatus Woesearchaeota archaeon]|nr:hypothetical protein [Candidatus Woesearchaeota archaeon]
MSRYKWKWCCNIVRRTKKRVGRSIIDWRKNRARSRSEREEIERRLKEYESDVKSETKSFKRFSSHQREKRKLVVDIKRLWNKKWERADHVLKHDLPRIIHSQIHFLTGLNESLEDSSLIVREVFQTPNYSDREVFNEEMSEGVTAEKGVVAHEMVVGGNDGIVSMINYHTAQIVEEIRQLKELLMRELDELERHTSWETVAQGDLITRIDEQDNIVSNVREVLGRLIIDSHALISEEEGRREEERKRVEEEEKIRKRRQERDDKEQAMYNRNEQGMLERFKRDASIEYRKLRIIHELEDIHENRELRRIYLRYLSIMREHNIAALSYFNSLDTRQVLRQIPEPKPTTRVLWGLKRDVIANLNNQNECIAALTTQITNGRYYFKQHLVEEHGHDEAAAHRDTHLSERLYQLIDLIGREFYAYKKKFARLLKRPLVFSVPCSITGRELPYYDERSMDNLINDLFGRISGSHTPYADYITEEEILCTRDEYEQYDDARKNRIERVRRKVFELFKQELEINPRGANILFHNQDFDSAAEIVKRGCISSGHELMRNEGANLRRMPVGVGSAIWLDFNNPQNMGFGWSKFQNGGVAFAVPVSKALHNQYIIRVNNVNGIVLYLHKELGGEHTDKVDALNTKVFMRDSIAMIPVSLFNEWEAIFKAISNRPYVTIYIDTGSRSPSHRFEFDSDLVKGAPNRVLVPFLRSLNIPFNPVAGHAVGFRDQNTWVEGTSYDIRGNCTDYKVFNPGDE